MASSSSSLPPEQEQGKERQQHHHPPRLPPKAVGMATNARRGDPKDRRGVSPTAKPVTRQSPTAHPPEKKPALSQKATPSNLRSTASSRLDQAPSASSKPAATKTPSMAAPLPKKLTRTKSMERPPPAVQPSRTVKESTLTRSATARPTKIASMASHPPPGARPKPVPAKKKEPAASEPLHDHHLDALETMSEPDLLAPAAKLTPEDDEHPQSGGDAGTEEPPPPLALSAENPRLLVEDANEKPEQLQPREQPRTARDHLLGRPKSFSHTQIPSSSRSGAVDDELQRKLRARQAWELEKEAGSAAEDNGGGKQSNGNNMSVGKSAAEKRRNKVLALVGAFETVMSLQEPQSTETPPPPQARAESPRAPASPSALEREVPKQGDAPPVAHCSEDDDEVAEDDDDIAALAEEKEAEAVAVAEEKKPEEEEEEEQKAEEAAENK